MVAKRYAQRHGVDNNEVFAPVARWDTIRPILAVAALKGWKVYRLDVKSVFLHGELSEDVIAQPSGYIKWGEEKKVHKLQKELYGLKQAPRTWYNKIESYGKECFSKCPHEHTLFAKTRTKGDLLIVILYVDVLIYTG